ncbi:DUF4397 domain-containing protein [Mucilaginibacter sp. 14171R-50]|uniref:DUF4397 domain-containing protein n=1 Tax=Mucilaginibacter sp. 14171R-50 TaxID=2703789 RepID=UPI00138D93BE|nr:DUF4397 domain-containing protein [Mucilaginibacter sp. 14171R-50]QHS57783.1 DUF4397 domain-containing protein [Mucilaginibacter sp. 14171R-50]
MKVNRLIFIVFMAFLGVQSCKKGDDAPITKPTTLINFINASTDTLNFYVNGSRLNTLASSYPQGSTGYISTPLGEQNYQAKKMGSPVELFDLRLPLDSGSIYSLYITDGTLENTFTTTDSLYTLPDTVTTIRFVHTSPNLGGVDVFVGDTVNFKARTFKSASVFLEVNPGVKRIRIYKAGTTELLSDEQRTLQSRRAYTLFTKGALSTAGSASSGTGLIINK